MSTHHTTRAHTATARFTVTGWDENVLVDINGEGTDINGVTYPKRGFSQVTASYSYTGDLEGTGLVDYLISYREAAAPVSGFERFEGSLDGHDGSFVLQHTGDQDADGVRATLQVVEGMGTGGLQGISGEAFVEIAGHSDDGYAITLTYDL